MAIAGVHKIPLLDSSSLRESGSPQSRQWGEQDRTSTQTSSLLRLWRELEGEHVVNHFNARAGERPQQQRNDSSNPDCIGAFMVGGRESVKGNKSLESDDIQNECGTCSESPVGTENDHEDTNSVGSELSADLGEVERQHVGQIFCEWINGGAKGHSPNVPHRNNHSKAQWLGEDECDPARGIMGLVQVNCQHRGTCGSSTDEGASETGSQVELVLDGSLVNHCEIGERRPIRKSCGRQALLDLLAKAQRERNKELQELLEHKCVSSFFHRNHIQALLRGRFFRNEIVAHDVKPTSRATSELGFLRQRHAVSNLREGFLSRLDDSVCGSPRSSHMDTSSNSDHVRQTNDQFQAENEQEVLDDIYDLFEPSDEKREGNGFPIERNLGNDLMGEPNQHASTSQSAGSQEQVVGQQMEHPSNLEIVKCGRTVKGASGPLGESNADERSKKMSEFEASVEGHLEDAHEVFQEQDAATIEASCAHEIDGDQVEDLQVCATGGLDCQEASAQVEEWQESALDHEEGDWQQLGNVESDEWRREGNEEGLSETLQEGTDNHWNQDRLANEFGEQGHTQEPQDDWHGNDLEETIDRWSDVPSGVEGGPIRRVDAFYYPDDDNVYRMELRELLSRRRVSSLLRSGFRTSLDQLIQSYVERQGNASLDWEPEGTSSPPAFIEPGQEQQHGDQGHNDSHLGGFDGTSLSARASHSVWDQDLLGMDWSHQSTHHHLGIVWEIISELRIDLVRLQHHMNTMQRMLEACMDMQLELQRSVRQEVSAALNRSAVSEDVCKDRGPKDEAKWDCVRKGICCICCERIMDSLLYRCGHMCTCTSCAENLVQGKEKCPMCQAPIVEVIRAYSSRS